MDQGWVGLGTGLSAIGSRPVTDEVQIGQLLYPSTIIIHRAHPHTVLCCAVLCCTQPQHLSSFIAALGTLATTNSFYSPCDALDDLQRPLLRFLYAPFVLMMPLAPRRPPKPDH